MKKPAQLTSTQAFTEIVDIRDDIVLLRNNSACIILSITSVNFSLLAGEEQDAKVFAYAALLNSLSFPVQILIRSKPIQLLSYVSSIEHVIQKTQNPNLKQYVTKYKDFVNSLIQTSSILDKQFYLIISYTSLEEGASSLVAGRGADAKEQFFQQAQTSLETKADSLLSQIHRLSLQASILQKSELTRLFYDIYNQGESFSLTGEDIESSLVKKNI